MGAWTSVKRVYGTLERQAAWLLVGGLALAAVWNGRQWRKDRRRLDQLARQKKETYDRGETPRVSILVPAWNEAGNIEPCIESILELRYPDKELIVCAGGEDRTLELARGYEDDRLIVLEQRAGEGKQGALRHSFEYATGEVVFLTDADCRLDDGSFEGTLAPVLAEGEDAATGSWRPLNRQVGHPFVQFQWSHHLNREVWMPEVAPALDGRNAAVRRAALERVGAFWADAPIGTDYVLSKQLAKAGYRIRFVYGSRVQTRYPETARAYFRQQSRWFRNPVLLGGRYGDWPLALAVLRAGLASVPLLAVPAVGGLGSRFLWALWLVAAFHLWLAAARVTRLMERVLDWPLEARRYALLPVYLVVGWMAMARGLAETALSKRRWRW